MSEGSTKVFSDEITQDVRQTWSIINGNLQAVGIEILLRLFNRYPSYQLLFAKFEDVPIDELKTKKEFLRHASSVANALNSALESLDDAEKLVPLLTRVGLSHLRHNVTAEHFQNIQGVVLETVQQALGDHSSEKIISAWNEVLAVAISVIIKGATK